MATTLHSVTGSLVLGAENPAAQPLTHARILIDNPVVKAANITSATAGESGFPASAIANPLTYEAYKPVATATAAVIMDAGEAVKANAIGIAAHTLGSNGAGVKLLARASSADPWVEVIAWNPGSDRPQLKLFDELELRQWQFQILQQPGFQPQVAVVYIGRVLAMPRPIYGGHAPLDLARVTAVRPSVSETGQFLGRSIIRKGLRTDYEWSHLDPAWAREHLDPVRKEMRKRPFFLAWRPAKYPDEVGYCWTPGDTELANMGVQRFMRFSMSVEGLDVAVEEAA